MPFQVTSGMESWFVGKWGLGILVMWRHWPYISFKHLKVLRVLFHMTDERKDMNTGGKNEWIEIYIENFLKLAYASYT